MHATRLINGLYRVFDYRTGMEALYNANGTYRGGCLSDSPAAREALRVKREEERHFFATGRSTFGLGG